MPDEIPSTNEPSRTDADSVGSLDNEADRQRRIAALHAIAQGQQQLEPQAMRPSRAERPAQRKRSRRQRSRTRWLVVGAALICVAVVGALVLRGLLTTPPRHTRNAPAPPAILTLDPTVDGIGCPYDVAWSPSGTSIAVLGAPNCGGPGAVYLYDTTTGKLTTKIQLDAPVRAALSAFITAASGQPSTFYQHVGWSPDGRRLAVTFFTTFPDNPDTSLAITGVVVGDATGGQPHVLVEEQRGFSFYTRWDLSADTGTLVPAPVTGNPTVFSTLPPALSYQWGANGTISPTTPLPNNPVSAAPAPVPVGNPDGDPSFTIWQPATAVFEVHTPSPDPAQHDVAAQAYTFQTDFVAWSPDGRYLLDEVQVVGRLAPPGKPTPSQRQLDALGLAQAPLLPIRDGALGNLLQQMQPGETDALAWRRYGEYVAVQRVMPYRLSGTGIAARDHTVTIYDCFTGQIVGTLKPEPGLPRFNDISQLRWSPDGSRLLLYDEDLGTVTIWGPSVLPKG